MSSPPPSVDELVHAQWLLDTLVGDEIHAAALVAARAEYLSGRSELSEP